ncbi:Protein of unknown function (DUF4232) [Goodfellowiella coeruleoviolacea]|uniref:DUF4232 domain-containing protein n=1 Tax=Goodfellowiella coeruleoviolacea TaxID=334858 RepID=A0AAE3GKP8_9PSEU|nr:Protein of unknown function (DUF4232) [Goodfellowiella coeruleoviolacea]
MLTLGVTAGCAAGTGGTAAPSGAGGADSGQTGQPGTAASTGSGTAAGEATAAGGAVFGTGTAGTSATAAGVERCHTGDLSTHLGTAALNRDSGVTGGTVPLVYTNTSNRTCTMYGFGGVDLRGPDDPNGPVYSLRRGANPQQDPASGGTPTLVTLAPGGTAHTLITFVTPSGDSVGSAGSTDWIPTEVVSTPPDETTQLTTPWLTGISVLRQDMATRVGTYISPVLPGSE